MSGWKAIESAPMDGTTILVFNGYRMTTAFWRRNFGYWSLEISGTNGRCDDTVYGVTHWMHLPEKPKEK